jgi:hypothetical protein
MEHQAPFWSRPLPLTRAPDYAKPPNLPGDRMVPDIPKIRIALLRASS